MEVALEMSPVQVHALVSAMRDCGVSVTLSRATLMVGALALFKALTLEEAYWLGRATLCCDRSEFAAYDECFAELFSDARLLPRDRQYGHSDAEQRLSRRRGEESNPADGKSPQTSSAVTASTGNLATDARAEPGALDAADRAASVGGAGAADIDALRSKDFTSLTDAERREVLTMMGALTSPGLRRISRRQDSCRSGAMDLRRTVASALAHAGDPQQLFRQRQRLRPRRCILLIDVSGSMACYSALLLRLGYALVQSRPRYTEVFTIGTRLTRVTRFLETRDVDAALPRATSAVPDWQGGTRLGEQLKVFLDFWGQRGMARGAQVIIASDGWERGDCSLLINQMQRLERLSFRIVWCNPHKGTPGYEPTARGMRAVLPYVDEFVAGASLQDMQALAAFIGGEPGIGPRAARHGGRLRRAS
jgi:hypothetical protein